MMEKNRLQGTHALSTSLIGATCVSNTAFLLATAGNDMLLLLKAIWNKGGLSAYHSSGELSGPYLILWRRVMCAVVAPVKMNEMRYLMTGLRRSY